MQIVLMNIGYTAVNNNACYRLKVLEITAYLRFI